jgi:hypothetical protein
VVGVALVGLVSLVLGLVVEARGRHEVTGVHVVTDGPGLAYGVRDGSGWDCRFTRTDFTCGNGSGRGKSIGSDRRGEFDVAGRFEAGETLVVVFDPVDWLCDLREDRGRFHCQVR